MPSCLLAKFYLSYLNYNAPCLRIKFKNHGFQYNNSLFWMIWGNISRNLQMLYNPMELLVPCRGKRGVGPNLLERNDRCRKVGTTGGAWEENIFGMYPLWLFVTYPWKDPPICKNGKPSISMGHLYHGYVK